MTGRRCCSGAGSARTATVTRRCWPRAASTQTAPVRWKGATAAAATSRSAWSLMASRSPVCPRNCPPGPGSSPLARDGRPTLPVRIRWRRPGLHSPGLRVITADDATVALRLLADRRDELGTARSQTVNRLHRLLLELLPGGAKKFLSAAQAKELLATVRPRDIAGK